MQKETVVYDGRIVPKEGFRVFIYSFDNQTKLVESWDEYQEHISSGIWYAKKNTPEMIRQGHIANRQQKKRERG